MACTCKQRDHRVRNTKQEGLVDVAKVVEVIAIIHMGIKRREMIKNVCLQPNKQ